ncbi:alpha-1,3/1,6-mannosyltransferase ALG2-like [Saccoglossus kowalevskii]|uniref:Alpha-1,3/1,6-mannosyltransferase ALG2 n=1 Tax=Saccoglossus kowalevskii TaxID=10224 RepID=A0ABM0GYG3_SACKO|nr:PREDICTED: alpha-1,3/1,6-mannosyltransferase ALG2-like [Saccoglossus kowalevskii]
MVNVAFVHPDLGIGGAERLVVDAALALKSQGHSVKLFTAHHDPSHCFKETQDGSLSVTCVGDWLPRSIFGGCYALCAYIRMMYVALYLVCFSGLHYDIVICDQISACIPILKFRKAKILFYCHFPDQLLTKRISFMKKLYRGPIDWLEEKTTGMADCILVNSQFTGETFASTFTTLSHIKPQVLYPSLNFSAFDVPVSDAGDLIPRNIRTLFLSINRYERKKNLGLAIEAFGDLKKNLADDRWGEVHLVMAGGYDDRVVENKEHYLELRQLTEKLKLNDNVTFLRSFSDSEKLTLLHNCTCLLYTPSNEHFGIVPIEAMYMKRPVIAANSGGPLESIDNEVTGYLCPPESKQFAEKMKRFVDDGGLSSKLGKAGHQRVIDKFSFQAFTDQLHNIVTRYCES